MYFPQAYGFYFNITWLPTYLESGAVGSRPCSSACWPGLPLILSAAADLVGGVTTDRAVRGLRRCAWAVRGRDRLAPDRRASA